MYLHVAKALLNNLKESYKNDAYTSEKKNFKTKKDKYICYIRYIDKLSILDRFFLYRTLIAKLFSNLSNVP